MVYGICVCVCVVETVYYKYPFIASSLFVSRCVCANWTKDSFLRWICIKVEKMRDPPSYKPMLCALCSLHIQICYCSGSGAWWRCLVKSSPKKNDENFLIDIVYSMLINLYTENSYFHPTVSQCASACAWCSWFIGRTFKRNLFLKKIRFCLSIPHLASGSRVDLVWFGSVAFECFPSSTVHFSQLPF